MDRALSKRYDPQEVENEWYKVWEKNFSGVSEEINEKRRPYTIVMPPPNVTGRLHMGHALDETVQDVIIRFKRMRGFDVLWLPGTDHSAIATEAKIVAQMREEGISKAQLGREAFLKRAFEWKENYGGQIVSQIKRLGCSCDWSKERFTMDEGCSKAVIEVFVNLYGRGLIYKGERTVNWCPKCKTSISDAEVEYTERDGYLWHINYDVEGGGTLTIATTRPETMLGDTAVAVNGKDERFKNLVGKTAIVPLVNRRVPIIADDHVLMDFGTGVLKVTPAHDPNDFEIGLRHRLPSINVMTQDGKINENGDKYRGLGLMEAREAILKDLEAFGKLAGTKPLKHNVGLCYRCGETIEPMALVQWFVRMKELAKPAIDAVRKKEVEFVPERFEKIYFNWLENIKDWCISRQLWWGHRIPAYYCADCSHMMVAKEPMVSCQRCGSKKIKQDEDTLDTWFSSALWPFSTLGWPEKTKMLDKFFPTQTLVTAYDIIFFWVARMVFMSLDQMKVAPFKYVYIHGLVRDAQGRKMSKSLGNGVDPLSVIERDGADALRMALMIGVSPGSDVKFSDEKVLLARNFTNKIWNAARFILMNVPEELDGELRVNELEIADKWVIGKLNHLIDEVSANLDGFEFGIALQKIYDFTWDVFCDWYIEIAKVKIKTQEPNVRGVLVFVMRNILKLLHPFMPFVTEELWQAFQSDGESIMIQPWSESDRGAMFETEIAEFEKLVLVIRAIRSARAEGKVPQNKKVKVYILTEDEIIKNSGKLIMALGFAESVDFDVCGVKTDEMFATNTGAARIFVLVVDAVDKGKERARLVTMLEKYQKEHEVLEQRLAKKEIWEKAPNVAAKYKVEMEELTRCIANVEESLQQIAEGGGLGDGD
ncbi:MAG: valine--tRNA ligase [Oscillospiraceae bacterium]|jgi:valyl-tRNA synthetase|nr:valine--tRNA ligase [Oscillospiraceae bacterium]